MSTTNTLEKLKDEAIGKLVILEEAVAGADIRAVHQEQIAKLKAEYEGLTIAGIDDKAGYDTVQKAITAVTKVATGIKATAKDLTKPLYDTKKLVDDYARDLENQVRDEVLAPLQAKKQAVLDERARIEREAAEARERALQERKDAFTKLGFGLFGTMYQHTVPGIAPVDSIQALAMEDESFEELLTGLTKTVTKAREEHEAAERKRAEEAEAARKAQEQAKEAAQQLHNARRKELEALGAMSNECPMDPYSQYDQAQWDDEVRQVKVLVERRKEEEAKEKEQQRMMALIDKRIVELKGAGWDHHANASAMVLRENGEVVVSLKENDLFAFDEDVIEGYVNRGNSELLRRRKAEEQRIAKEAEEKERQRIADEAAAKEKAEQEAKAAAGDAEWLLGQAMKPVEDVRDNICLREFKTATAKQGMEHVKRHLADAISNLQGIINDLK